MELDGFVGEGREGLAGGEDGDGAAEIAGEGLDLFQGGEGQGFLLADGG